MASVNSLCVLNVLVIILILWNNVTGSQADLSETDLFEADFFEKVKQAYPKQREYMEVWNKLIVENEIKEIKNSYTEYGVFDMYRLDGEKVKAMKLKDIFCMLQNWILIQHDAKHRVVEMNIGGETYSFRIYLDPFRKGNILISNLNGEKVKKYSYYFKQLDNGNIANIAKAMLQSLHEPMGAQTKWEGAEISIQNSQKVMSTMREFMVVTQVAEAARPTDESFDALVKIMDEVTITWQKDWEDLMKNVMDEFYSRFKLLQEQKIEVVTSKSRAMSETILAQLSLLDVTLPDKFISELTETANEIKNRKHKTNDGKLVEWDNKMRKLLSYHKQSLLLKEEKYKMLQSLLFIEKEQLKQLKILPHLKRNPKLKEQLSRSVSKITPDRISTLLNVPKRVLRPKEFITGLAETAIKYITDVKKSWIYKVYNYKPKNGRIPSADEWARYIFEIISKGKYMSFREAFKQLFPLSEKKGTQLGRINLFDLDEKYILLLGSALGEESNSRKRHLEPKEAAVGDGDESGLAKKIKLSLSASSCENRRKRDGSCSLKRLKVVDDTFMWEGETLYYQTVDEDGKKITHTIDVDVEKMATLKFTKQRLSNLKESGLLKKTDKAGKALGVYGAAVSILASIQYFSQEEYGRGAFSAIQAAHGIGGLTAINDVVAKVTKRALRKAVTITVEKIGLGKTLERMSEVGAKALGQSTSKVLGRLVGGLPFVGLAFDSYFITEDIIDLYDENSPTPEALKITHLVLDLDTTILTIFETAQPELIPFLEPFIIGLTAQRLSIDNFYLEIQDELAKVKGKDFGEQVGAFLKGFGEGIVDFFTLGTVEQIKVLKKHQEHDRQLLRNLSNPASYFEVTFKGLDENGNPVGTVDFTAGILSQFGGFLTVKLNENGTFTVELPEVPTESGIPTRVVRTFSFGHPVTDVVLGVGNVANPRYRHEEAKLWLFIPVPVPFDNIDGFDTHKSSQYGVYTGNSHDNNFYAVQGGTKRRKRSSLYNNHRYSRTTQPEQDCESFRKLTVHLNSYHYDLYGRGGDDRFFLGPQTSRVTGGDGKDLFFINANGGKTIINNFAHDQEMDTLYLNVSHERIRCERDEWDLLVNYCQEAGHAIKIKNWFSHGNDQFYRHIYLATRDGVVITVTDSEVKNSQHQISCNAVSVDKSSSTFGETLTLTGALSQVKQVTGSNYSDVITGNEKPNILYGGLGDDEITGANGSDIYLVKRGGGRETINNYATDRQEDTIIFGVPFEQILVEESHQNDLVLYASGDRSTTQVTLQSWFEGPDWQHAVFVSSDSIRFVVKKNDNEIPRKHPLSIDLSTYEHGVRLNLRNSSDNPNIHVDTELMDEVKVIIDSPYNDTIIGNALGNILSCSGGLDFLQGNGGKDTYVIDERCSHVTIENRDSKGDFDMMLLKCSSQNIRLSLFNSHLILRCNLSYGYFEVHLNHWFQSPEQRHLIVKTSDKMAALLPATIAELTSNEGRLFPYQIEADEDCGRELRVINLSVPLFSQCERFVAKSDLCSYTIFGNELNNYIDPGPGNRFVSQYLMGNNGTDTYVMGHRYGIFNTIDNFAEDKELDHLKFNVVFHDIEVLRDGSHATLTSRSRNDSIRVTVIKYYTGAVYQHLLVHSIDGVLFKLKEEFPYTEVIIVDFSTSISSQVLSAQENTTFSTARVLIGSKFAQNHIEGGTNTTKIIGGQKNDSIIGGPGGEDLIGLDGHDSIYGGPGNNAIYGGNGDDFLHGGLDDDVFYGGMGADTIIGGLGSNTVVFSGYSFTGVSINLQIGLGWGADAEGDSYEMIDNILASEYDDSLIGNDNNNVIRGYGGDDFIFPAGGEDLLQGGGGFDVYQLDNAFGHKVINNFATDEELDLIVMNQTSLHAICYHFHGEDLQLTVDFSNANSTEAVSRVFLGEDFLMITLPFWLRNSTYQHVAFSFADGYLTPEDFDEDNRQLEPTIDLVNNGRLLYNIIVSGNSIILTFNGSFWNDEYNSQETASLQYVHFENNSTTYYPLNVIPTEPVTFNDLEAGSTHSFTVILSSCELNIAMSPILYGTISPNQPTGLIADPLMDGFVLSWNPPTSLSDPSVEEYEYIVRIWSIEQAGDDFEQTTNGSNISVFSLIPETTYHISVSSLVYNTTSTPVEITARSGRNTCTNLVHLPSHMRIDDLTRNEQGSIVAIVTCETGYELKGASNIVCNDSTSTVPNCTRTVCPQPLVTNAKLVVGSDIPVYGDTFIWRCDNGYEIPPDKTNTSFCDHQSQWTPEIPICQEKPKCSLLNVPNYGNVTATVIYAGESVTYSCSSGYYRRGPVHKHCIRVAGNEAHLSPLADTKCEPLPCPALLNQTHGFYNESRSQYVAGDMVELFCNEGYYARDDRYHPDRARFICNGYDWNPPQRHCQSIIEVFDARHYVSLVDVAVQYTISSLQGHTVPESLHSQACGQILPYFTRWVSYREGNIQRLECQRQIDLAYGPTPYEGILKISSQNDYAYVCVERNNAFTAIEICRTLGFGQYTSSIYHSSAITTTYRTTHSLLIIPQVQQCYNRISCRKTCNRLTLPNGNWNSGCPYTLEGQTCYFYCNAGFGRIGSASRQCTRNGWTGQQTFCDGSLWETDIERESRLHSYRSHQDLANYLRDYLRDNYPGVDWVVVVYDDVTGFERHTVIGYTKKYLWRHYGHNIVVGRRLPNYGSFHYDLSSLFWGAYSPSFYSVGFLGLGGSVLHAEQTCIATWNRLVNQGVSPIMLHIVRGGIGYGTAWNFNSRSLVSTRLGEDGFATLIA